MASPLCLSARSSLITQQRLLNRGHIKSTDEASLTTPYLHTSIIRFLLQNKAPSHHRLHDEEKAFRISRKVTGVNTVSGETTPVMNAIRNGLVVKLLREKDTELEKDAEVVGDREYIDAGGIVSRNDEKSFVTRVLEDLVNGFNAATNNALTCGLGIHGHACNPGEKYPVESEAEVQFDPMKQLGKDITGHIGNLGLSKFFPANSKFLQTMMSKVSALAETGSTPLARPEYLSGLSRLSLYQPILFCDNSGSMKTGTRIDSMISVTRQITSITTHLVPPDEGVHIRFLNTSSKEQLLYDTYGAVNTPDAAAEMVSKAGYTGVTKLGTILRKVILEPFVYQHLENNRKLERPLLVAIITDGCPLGEDRHHLKNVIIECKQKLADAEYPLSTVCFQINQIGNDPAAEAFLNSLRTDDEIRNYIFCASERLDEKFMELGEDKEKQEIWMFETLTAPLVQEK